MTVHRDGAGQGGAVVLGVAGLLGALVCPLAHAEGWQLERSVEGRLDSNDNPSLSSRPAARLNSAVLAAASSVARSAESASSRLAIDLAGTRQTDTTPGRLEGSLSLNQSFTEPVDGFDLGWRYQSNATLDSSLASASASSSDLLLGRGDQRSRVLNAGWSHRVDERWTTRLQASQGATDYAAALASAVAFRSRGFGASLQRQLDERDGVSLSLNHSAFLPQPAAGRARGDSTTDELNLAFNHALSPTDSASLSIGRYRSESATTQAVLACPLAVELCLAGRVPFQVLQRTGSRTRWGQQASVSWTGRLDERSDAAFSAARALAPSGAGAVVRSDTLTLRLSRNWSETLSASLNLSASATQYLGVAASPQPRLQTLALALSESLDPDTMLQLSAQHSRASDLRVHSSARGNRVALSLRHVWPALSGSSR
ncbi:MAG: hypothetical protein AB9M53_02530 [Leptothrix sp. (in: b-proteobacteria)]